jgi:HSP20 family molecular chaperone IbpA/RNA polymerase subunit RPABC4/transcription elongation factor Spt4
MLKKNKCKNCNRKIKNSYSFCPNCGFPIKEQKNKYGMLGKKDDEQDKINPKIFGGIGGGMMNKMLGNALKMLEKEMTKEMGDMNNLSNGKIRLMINGKEITPKKNKDEPKQKNTKFLPIDFSKDNLKKWKRLSKEEPKSNLKRVGDKINYEIEVPEVRSIQDVSIIKLENSLEVRAVGENKAYVKRIPIDLPLKKYSLLKGLLTLEMNAE